MTRPLVQTLRAAALGIAVVTAGGCGLFPQTEAPAEAFDSAGTTARVKTALAADRVLSLFQIEVETFRDVVQLSGFVDNEEQRQAAEEVASRVEGVNRIENDLLIKPAA